MLGIIILIIILILFLFFAVFFVIQFYNIIFRGYAPFVYTNKNIINKIVNEIEVQPNAIVYELGSGKAPFLRAIRKKYPKTELIGVEYSFFPWMVGNIQNSFTNSQIKILKKNIFNVKLDKANVIYCYLNQKTMEKLEKKFKNECQKGTQIISYTFKLPNEKPDKILEINNERVYIYTIK